MTLIEFLRARLDERHARAAKLLRYAQENDVAVRDPRLLGRHIPGWHEWPEVEQMAREVLADIDAKRRIVEMCEEVLTVKRDVTEDWPAAAALAVDILAVMGEPYVDHPDYDQEWKP